MPIYRLGDLTPRIDPLAFVHPDAVVIGDVTIGAESTVWPCAVLRGDHGAIVVGARTSVQDGTVVHAGPGSHRGDPRAVHPRDDHHAEGVHRRRDGALPRASRDACGDA